MAQIWVTGPAALYVTTPDSPDTFQFLGHGEDPPTITEERYWDEVRCDLAGASAPFDKIYQGKSVRISVNVIRYNLDVFEKLRSYPNTINNPGVDQWGIRGTLMVQELTALKLAVAFPYSAKATMLGLPRGLLFPNVILEGPDEYEIGTRARKIRSRFQCFPRYNPADGSFTIYTNEDFPATIPLFPPN